LATRPAASFVGRIFIDSDNPSTGLYRDTGTAWVQIADPGAGTTGTLQQVTTNGNSTTTGITITTNGLGIGTTIPGSNRLDIHSASGINATFNGTGTTNAALQLQSAGVGKWNVRNNYNAGANDFQIFDVLNSVSRLQITNTGVSFFSSRLNVNGATDNSLYALNVIGAINASTNILGFTSYFDNYDLAANVTNNTGKFVINDNTNTTSFIGQGFSSLFIQNNVYYNGSSYSFPNVAVANSVITLGGGAINFQTGAAATNPSTKIIIKNTGILNIVSTQTYATNALAVAGGLVTGDIYKNAVGVLSIVL
jgi:hypothetical protein